MKNFYAAKNRDRLFTSVRAKKQRQLESQARAAARNKSNDSLQRSNEMDGAASADLQNSLEIDRPRTVQSTGKHKVKELA